MILRRFMRVMTLLVVLLAPPTMMASHSASAAPMSPSAMAGHCASADDEDEDQSPRGDIDCTILCSAIPGTSAPLAAQVAVPAIELAQSRYAAGHGVVPASDPPPPRRS